MSDDHSSDPITEDSFTLCDHCNKPRAFSRCTKCNTVYYCSVTCQRAAYRAHKRECEAFYASCVRIREDRLRIIARAAKLEEETATQECAICLNPLGGESKDASSLDMAPVMTECGHVFCMHCIRGHTMKSLDETRTDDPEYLIACPLCCQDATDVALLPQLLYKNAAEFARLAYASRREGRPPSEINRYCTLARREMAKMSVGGYWNKSHLQQPIIQQLMVELSELEGSYAVAVEQGTALLQSMEKVEPKTLESTLTQMDCSSVIVNSLMALQQFAEAITHLNENTIKYMVDCYTHLEAEVNGMQMGSRFAVLHRQFYHDLSRCLYEVGAYDRSIRAAEVAIESNRHFENVYEYLVKSYQAMNDLPTAIVMMKRATRYDSPWDKERQQMLRGRLREMEMELEGLYRRVYTAECTSKDKRDKR